MRCSRTPVNGSTKDSGAKAADRLRPRLIAGMCGILQPRISVGVAHGDVGGRESESSRVRAARDTSKMGCVGLERPREMPRSGERSGGGQLGGTFSDDGHAACPLPMISRPAIQIGTGEYSGIHITHQRRERTTFADLDGAGVLIGRRIADNRLCGRSADHAQIADRSAG